jgi:hypothetical protein
VHIPTPMWTLWSLMKLQTFLFQMVVTSCISVQYVWKYGFAKSFDNWYVPFVIILYSGPTGYDWLDIRPTWVTTKIFVLTYNQCQHGEHISGITCSSLRALAVFALFCRRDNANSAYQSMYSVNKYRVTEKGCVSLTARSSINQALQPAWRS